MHNGMNQQAYAYLATAALPMIGYPMPTGFSQTLEVNVYFS